MSTMHKGIFAAAALLGFASLTACVDDEKKLNPDPQDNKPPVSCEEDPTQDKCDPGEVSCEEDPTQDKCQVDETTDALLYLSGVSIAALEDNTPSCCVDFDEDGVYDNNVVVGLEKILRTLEADGNLPIDAPNGEDAIDVARDLTGLFNGLIEDGSLTVLFETDAFPTDYNAGGAFTLNAHKGSSDSDAAARAAGDGVFELEDALTSLAATLADGVVDAHAEGDVSIPWHIKLKHGPHVLGDLDIAELSVRLQVEADDAGRPQTTTATTDADGKPVNYLAGAVRGESAVNAVNQLVSGFCGVGAFLGFDQSEAAANGAVPAVIADADVVTALENHSDSLCVGLGAYAVKADSVARLFDVDTDGNGVNDAMSFGMNIRLVAGTDADKVVVTHEPRALYLNSVTVQDDADAFENNLLVLVQKTFATLLGDGNVPDGFPSGNDVDAADELNAIFAGLISDGTLSVLFDSEAFPTDIQNGGTFALSAYKAASDSDDSDRATGQGIFSLRSLLANFDASLVEGVLKAAAANDLVIPYQLRLKHNRHAVGTLNIASVHVRAQLEEDANGVTHTTAAVVDGNGDRVNYLTGAARGESLVDAVNTLVIAYCALDSDDNLLVFSQDPADADGSIPSITVDPAVEATLASHFDTLCSGVAHYAARTDSVTRLFDIDTDGNGVNDAVSAAFNISLTDATVAE